MVLAAGCMILRDFGVRTGLHATAGVLGEAVLAFAEENRSLEAQIELRDILLEFMDLASTLYY